MSNDPKAFREALALRGATKVKALLERGYFNDDELLLAEQWLSDLELERLDLASRPVVKIANKANAIAVASMIIAIAAALISFLSWAFPHH